ncbi:MAG: CocE/NonD family hydrolase [Actinomycetota bacterium]
MLKATRARRALCAISILAAGLGIQVASAEDQNPLDGMQGGPTDFYSVSDGTSIAFTTCYPNNYDPSKSYPAILEMAGYENGSQGITFDPDGYPHCTGRTTTGQLRDWYGENGDYGNPPEPPLAEDSDAIAMGTHYHDDYFVIHASVRGTGCSGGEFDLFSSRSALDGYELIEDYIVRDAQHPSWKSNGKVGLIGHSYSGITATFIAETQPPSLVVSSLSGLIDDLYRGITYPGGIFNGLFPPEWNLGLRNAYDVAGASAQGLVRNLRDRPALAQQCAANMATHRRNVLDDPLVHGLGQTDSEWFRARSLITLVSKINRPYMATGTFQDEQTGPRFEHFWEQIPAGLPKRLLMTNGNHGTNVAPEQVWKDRKAWIDHWMGIPDGNNYYEEIGFDPGATPVSVRTLFELKTDNTTDETKDSTSFPREDTAWTPFFVNGVDATTGSGTLSTTAATAAGSASYLSGTKRQSWSFEVQGDTGQNPGPPATTRHAPDELEFRYTVPEGAPLVIDGPITANLFLSTTGIDTDMFVQVIDEFPGGTNMLVLQRGMQRASFDAIDAGHSDYFGIDPVVGGPFMYRPMRPYSSQTFVTPGEIKQYLVEVFPVAHIFRPGHTLLVKLMAPPAVDSQYSYTPGDSPVTLNTLHFSPTQPTRITLPVVGAPPGITAIGPACDGYQAIRCVSE